MKYIFIVNPISGGKSKAKLIQQLDEFALSNGLDYEIRYTSYARHAIEIAKGYSNDSNNILIAVGGDGTVNEVASSLIGAEAIFYVIPTGSGNGFARHNNIPLDLKTNLKRLIRCKNIKFTDVCFMNNMPFFNVSGMGFDAYVSIKFSELVGRGVSNYIKAVFSNFKNYQSTQCTFHVEGYPSFTEEIFMVSFANTSQFGNNVYIAPNADNQDGKVDVVIASKPKIRQIPNIALSLFQKKELKMKEVKYLRSSNIKMVCDDVHIHIDGEPINSKTNQIEVYVQKNALKLLSD